MRLHTLFFLGSLFFAPLAYGQNETSLKVELSTTEVRAGEPFEVTFLLENGNNASFTPPDWESASLSVLRTNQSSNFSFSNGKSSSTATYGFQVVATEAGEVQIPSAVVISGGKEYRTEPQTIRVSPGDGNVQTAPRKRPAPQSPAPPAQEDPKKKIKTIRL